MALYQIIGKKVLEGNLTKIMGSNRPGHALIMEGQEGTGKKTIALAFAKALLCDDPVDFDACGFCRHCCILQAGGQGERIILEKEKSISVDDIRSMLRDIQLLPVNSRRKAYLIIDGHKMTLQAQNCLLKTLEEPPRNRFILMTVEDSDQLLPTVRSRAVTLQTGINSTEEIRGHLDQNFKNSPDEKDFASRHAEGSIGKAITILESDEYGACRQSALAYARALMDGEYVESFRLIGGVQDRTVMTFLEILAGFFRDVAAYSFSCKEGQLRNPDKLDMIMESSNRYHAHTAVKLVFLIYHAMYQLNGNASERMTLDSMNIRIMEELGSI